MEPPRNGPNDSLPAEGRHLHWADAALDKLRLYLRLAHRWQWLSSGQYQHVSAMVAEVGRLLGGWIRATPDTRPDRTQ